MTAAPSMQAPGDGAVARHQPFLYRACFGALLLAVLCPGCQKLDGTPPLDHPADPMELGLTTADYSVVRSFIADEWGRFGAPPLDFLLAGTAPVVDTHLGIWTFQREWRGLEGLGPGLAVDYLGGLDRLYRDVTGVRLIAEEHAAIVTLILSAANAHPACPTEWSLSALRTESGIGLGDAADLLLELLGEPSLRRNFGDYQILWYLEKPEHAAIPVLSGGKYEFDEGRAAAYALKEGRVVEIWLHYWTTEAFD